MANFTNESFLEMIAEEYPNEDWDNLPDLDSAPSRWIIRGMQHRRLYFIESGKEIKDEVGFEVDEGYSTKELAKEAIERMKVNPEWCEENLFEDRPHKPMPSKEFHGPVKWDTVHVVELKPDNLIMKHFYKDCLDDIKAGKKVFPMYLP